MPVQDIFIQGRLEMSAVPLPEGAAEILWRDTDINRVLTVIAVLIGIAGIRELFRLMRPCPWNTTRAWSEPAIRRLLPAYFRSAS